MKEIFTDLFGEGGLSPRFLIILGVLAVVGVGVDAIRGRLPINIFSAQEPSVNVTSASYEPEFELQPGESVSCNNYEFETKEVFSIICGATGQKIFSTAFTDDLVFVRVHDGETSSIRYSELDPFHHESITNKVEGGQAIFIGHESDGRGSTLFNIVLIGSEARVLGFKTFEHIAPGDIVFNSKKGMIQIETWDHSLSLADGGSDGQRTGFASPRILLEIRDGKLEFSETMRKVLNQSRFDRDVVNTKRAIRNRGGDLPYGMVGNTMLRLIYNGSFDASWRYFDEISELVNSEEKSDFENLFTLTLEGSPFLDQVLDFNKKRLADVDGELACPEFAGRERFVDAVENH